MRKFRNIFTKAFAVAIPILALILLLVGYSADKISDALSKEGIAEVDDKSRNNEKVVLNAITESDISKTVYDVAIVFSNNASNSSYKMDVYYRNDSGDSGYRVSSNSNIYYSKTILQQVLSDTSSYIDFEDVWDIGVVFDNFVCSNIEFQWDIDLAGFSNKNLYITGNVTHTGSNVNDNFLTLNLMGTPNYDYCVQFDELTMTEKGKSGGVYVYHESPDEDYNNNNLWIDFFDTHMVGMDLYIDNSGAYNYMEAVIDDVQLYSDSKVTFEATDGDSSEYKHNIEVSGELILDDCEWDFYQDVNETFKVNKLVLKNYTTFDFMGYISDETTAKQSAFTINHLVTDATSEMYVNSGDNDSYAYAYIEKATLAESSIYWYNGSYGYIKNISYVQSMNTLSKQVWVMQINSGCEVTYTAATNYKIIPKVGEYNTDYYIGGTIKVDQTITAPWTEKYVFAGEANSEYIDLSATKTSREESSNVSAVDLTEHTNGDIVVSIPATVAAGTDITITIYDAANDTYNQSNTITMTIHVVEKNYYNYFYVNERTPDIDNRFGTNIWTLTYVPEDEDGDIYWLEGKYADGSSIGFYGDTLTEVYAELIKDTDGYYPKYTYITSTTDTIDFTNQTFNFATYSQYMTGHTYFYADLPVVQSSSNAELFNFYYDFNDTERVGVDNSMYLHLWFKQVTVPNGLIYTENHSYYGDLYIDIQGEYILSNPIPGNMINSYNPNSASDTYIYIGADETGALDRETRIEGKINFASHVDLYLYDNYGLNVGSINTGSGDVYFSSSAKTGNNAKLYIGEMYVGTSSYVSFQGSSVYSSNRVVIDYLELNTSINWTGGYGTINHIKIGSNYYGYASKNSDASLENFKVIDDINSKSALTFHVTDSTYNSYSYQTDGSSYDIYISRYNGSVDAYDSYDVTYGDTTFTTSIEYTGDDVPNVTSSDSRVTGKVQNGSLVLTINKKIVVDEEFTVTLETHANATHYSSRTEISFVIVAAELAVTFNPTNHEITYGDSFTQGYEYGPERSEQLKWGDTIAVVTVSGTPHYYYKGINGTVYPISDIKPTNSGEYQITMDWNLIVSADNYDAYLYVCDYANLKINKKELKLEPKDRTITYGEDPNDLVPTLDDVNLDGFVNGDLTNVLSGDLYFEYDYEQYDDVGVFNIYPRGQLTATNYEVSYWLGALTVNKKELKLEPKDRTIIYGDNPYDFIPTLEILNFDGFVNGDTTDVLSGELHFQYTYKQYDDVGTYDIQPYGTLTATNYEVSYWLGTLIVSKKELILEPKDRAITYGEDPTDYEATLDDFNYNGFENGDTKEVLSGEFYFTYGYEQYDDVGVYNIYTNGELTATNYEVTYNLGALTVNKKELILEPKDRDITYGENPTDYVPSLDDFDYNGFENDDTKEVLSGEFYFTYEYEQYDNVGVYNIYTHGELTATNYEVSYWLGVLTVNKKTLSLEPKERTITYGENPTDFVPTLDDVNFDGFENGDTKDVLSGELHFQYTYKQYDDVGTYDIQPYGTLTATNYEVSYWLGTLNVEEAELLVKIKPTGVETTYGTSLDTPDWEIDSIETLLGTDTFTKDNVTGIPVFKYPTSTTKPTNVGKYNIEMSGLTATLANYNVTIEYLPLEEGAVINVLGLTVPTINGTYTYNGANQTVSFTGLDSTYMTASNNTVKDAGEYTIVVELKDKTNTCWNLTPATTDDQELSLNVEEADLLVKIKPTGVETTYGTSLDTPDWEIDSIETLLGTDTFTKDNVTGTPVFKYPTSTTKPTNVGKYNIEMSGLTATLANYNVTIEYLPLEEGAVINVLKLTVPTITGTYEYTGINQNINFNNFDSTYMTANPSAVKDAGEYTIVVELKDKTNTCWNLTTATTDDQELSLNVEEAELLVKIKPTGVETTYGTSLDTPDWEIDSIETLLGTDTFTKDNVTGTPIFKYPTSTTKPTNVGKYNIEMSGLTATLANYNVTIEYLPLEEGAVINVLKLTVPTITGTYEYTGINQNINFNNFDSTYMTAATTMVKDAGEYTIVVELKDKTNTCWNLTPATTDNQELSLNVEEADLLVKIKPIGVETTYGTSLDTPDWEIDSIETLLGTDTFTKDNVTGTPIFKYPTSTTKPTNVGKYNIEMSGLTATLANYNVTIEYLPLEEGAVINVLGLTVPTINGTYTYNGANQTVSFTGLASTYMTASTTTVKDAGEYTIVVELKDKTNTCWNLTPATTDDQELELEVGQFVIGLEWSNTDLTYNGSEQKPTATVTGLFDGDTCEVEVIGAQINSSATPYTATASTLSNKNYALPTDNTTQFTISNAELTIELQPESVTTTYGTPLDDPEYKIASIGTLYGNDTFTKDNITGIVRFYYSSDTYEKSTTKPTNIGKYDIDMDGLTATLANYTVTIEYLTLVDGASITILKLTKPTIDGTYTYNGTDQTIKFNNFNSTFMSAEPTKVKNAGEYDITVTLTDTENTCWDDNSTTQVDLSVVVEQKVIGILWSNTQLTYNTTEQAPTATATGVYNEDVCEITVSGAQKNVGPHTAKAISLNNNNYVLPEDVECEYTISPLGISNATIEYLDEYSNDIEYEYAADLIEPIFNLSYLEEILVEDTDYTVTFNNNKNISTNAQIIVTGTGNYTGKYTYTFTIIQKDIKNLEMPNIPDQEYTGHEIQPTVAIYNGEHKLTAYLMQAGDEVIDGAIYDILVVYSNNIEVGPAGISISCREGGNYKGTETLSFEITKDNIDPGLLPDLQNYIRYVGTSLKSIELPYNEHGEWHFVDEDDTVGSVNSTGNIIDVVFISNDYEPVYDTVSIIVVLIDGKITIQSEAGAFDKIYNGQAISGETVLQNLSYTYDYVDQYTEPKNDTPIAITNNPVKLAWYQGSKKLEDTNPVNAGQYTAVLYVEATENYSAYSVEYDVTISQVDIYGSTTDTTTLGTNYAIVSPVKDVVYNNGNPVSGTVEIKHYIDGNVYYELVEDTDYSVLQGANVDCGDDEGTAYVISANNSNYKTSTTFITETFDIVNKPTNDGEEIVVDIYGVNDSLLNGQEFEYTGSAITPEFYVVATLKDVENAQPELIDPTNYDYQFTSNIERGSVTLTVLLKNGYTGSASATFTIVRNTITEDDVTSKDPIEEGQLPTITVTVDGKVLVEKEDYLVIPSVTTLSIDEPSSPYFVTVEGIGNYTGEVEVEYVPVISNPEPEFDVITIIDENDFYKFYIFDVTKSKKNWTEISRTDRTADLATNVYLKNVADGQLIAPFLTQFKNTDLVVKDANGNIISSELYESEVIKNGYTLELYNGEDLLDKITIIITGDCTGDGKVNGRDRTRLNNYIKDTTLYAKGSIEYLALDINIDGVINGKDTKSMNSHYYGTALLNDSYLIS